MSVDATFEIALSRTAEGDLNGAAEVYRQLLVEEPGNFKAWNNLGRVYERLEQPKDALVAFARAAEIAPDNPVVCFNHATGLHRAGEFTAATEAWQHTISLAPNDAEAHYNLAAAEHQLERLDAAIAAYREATRLQPDFYEAWSNLAQCLFEADDHLLSFEASMTASQLDAHAVDFFNMGRIAELLEDRDNASRHYLRALELDPDDTGTRVRCAEVLAALGAKDQAISVLRDHPTVHSLIGHTIDAIAGATGSRVSTDYVQALFDGFADSFDETLSRLGYQGPRLLREMLAATIAPDTLSYNAALDLGCGTGLLGEAMADHCQRLVGVDLSPKMLDVARSRGLYDSLVAEDILEFLTRADERFDLVIATDVFNYFGTLEPLLAGIAAVLTDSKHLAFSVEDLIESEAGYALQPTGRYQHNADHVREQLTRTGFQLLTEETHTMRHEGRKPVIGRFFCAQHSSSAVAAPPENQGRGLHPNE
ncbi:MAG: tetratricopeptide repeat protein [Pseudomonadota bacterium]